MEADRLGRFPDTLSCPPTSMSTAAPIRCHPERSRRTPTLSAPPIPLNASQPRKASRRALRIKSYRANPLARTRPSAVRISRRSGIGPRSFCSISSSLRVSGQPAPPVFVRDVTSCELLLPQLYLLSRIAPFDQIWSLASESSLPPILLSSLEDLSSVAENHPTKSRSCNNKISVQNSSFLCLTFIRFFCTIP